MLEIRDLKKTYKSKKGGETQALKGISLKFADKGLVFILGKSGCGKSTLLNLLGGLDSFDGGEIIVNGKSSKDFSAADFDSYRNTYLGFVFQEFNIIETFSIEKNIGLALQLQHRKSDKDEIDKILKKVELDGFGSRKPNELSGGQKQRVAIARALIKDPEIILADEPTGALDSATGKSVLNMLKKLAEEKLVIVVSHDREFAEEYADRIVELKDGVVISDRTREKVVDREKFKEEITPINSSIIRIPKGKALDERTIAEINNNLLNSKSDTFLMLGDEKEAESAYPETMQDIKDKGYISANTFTQTNESEIHSEKQAMKLIKSKLPAGDALKIGASNFKAKKFRLVFTIFLSVLSLVFFGFADIFASYNRSETYAKAFYEGDAYYMSVNKTYDMNQSGLSWSVQIPFSTSDIAALDEHFNNKILKAYNFESYQVSANFFKSSNDKFFQPSAYRGFLEAAEDNSLVAYGTFPKDYTEVMISDYMAKGYVDLSKSVSTTDGMKEYLFTSYEQVIGSTITIDGVDYTISGIYKTNFFNLYNKLKDYNEQQLNEDKEALLLQNAMTNDSNNLYSKVMVRSGFSNVLKGKLTVYNANLVPFIQSTAEYVYREPLSITIDDTGTLKKGQIMIPASYYKNTKYGYESTKTLQDLQSEFLAPQNIMCYVPVVQWAGDNKNGTIFEKNYDIINVFEDGNINNGGIIGGGGSIGGGGIIETLSTDKNSIVADNYSPTFPGGQSSYTIYMCKEDFEEVLNTIYSPAAVFVDARLSGEELLDTITYLQDGGFSVSARNSDSLQTADSLMKSLLKIFYIVAGVLAIFVMLLLYSFISMSVVNKKKEIGILRAIGARGLDIASIFIFESLIIGAIILAISIPAVILLADVLQNALLSAVSVKIISFSIRQVFTMSGLTLLILILSSIIPVLKISKRKPIDAILDK